MKIFLSHSSRQKLFIKELKKYLPHHINVWIDEQEIILGENIRFSIYSAIKNDCELFIAVIDEDALKSSWVIEEINLAIEKEEELGKNFLLPIIIDKNCWIGINDPKIKDKKSLFLHGFTDISIEALAKELTAEIFFWLCKEVDNKNYNAPASSFKIIQDADKISQLIGEEIKSVVHPHRKSNPLELVILANHLKAKKLINHAEKEKLLSIIDRLVQLNFLTGITYDSANIYLSQESYANKSSLYNHEKLAIAKKAFNYINPGQVIAIDAGSTTLELTKLICKDIKLKNLFDMKIITNSIPATYELLKTLGELQVNDYGSICDVYLLGGHARPKSFSISSEDKYLGTILENDLQTIFDKVGQADICFIGANGITSDFSFANHNKFEIKAKCDMLSNSKRKFILADASKFQVEEKSAFASLDEGLEIITFYEEKFSGSIKKFQDHLNNTPSKIIFA